MRDFLDLCRAYGQVGFSDRLRWRLHQRARARACDKHDPGVCSWWRPESNESTDALESAIRVASGIRSAGLLAVVTSAGTANSIAHNMACRSGTGLGLVVGITLPGARSMMPSDPGSFTTEACLGVEQAKKLIRMSAERVPYDQDVHRLAVPEPEQLSKKEQAVIARIESKRAAKLSWVHLEMVYMAGVNGPTRYRIPFILGVMAAAKAKGIPVVVDETQTAMFTTGRFFAFQSIADLAQKGIMPSYIVTGKSLSLAVVLSTAQDGNANNLRATLQSSATSIGTSLNMFAACEILKEATARATKDPLDLGGYAAKHLKEKLQQKFGLEPGSIKTLGRYMWLPEYELKEAPLPQCHTGMGRRLFLPMDMVPSDVDALLEIEHWNIRTCFRCGSDASLIMCPTCPSSWCGTHGDDSALKCEVCTGSRLTAQ
jgi:hypothetical protein